MNVAIRRLKLNAPRNQCVTIHVDTHPRYHAVQPLNDIHARKTAKFSSAVVTAAQGNVETATRHESMPSASLKSDCAVSVVTR